MNELECLNPIQGDLPELLPSSRTIFGFVSEFIVIFSKPMNFSDKTKDRWIESRTAGLSRRRRASMPPP
ncbi:hypothetical protein HanRHA438_Chr02g0058961 [Helianthus annuus]|uniref:Uncharacterized protein n=1 Tax=Helianthus annuus TaxID=4232 RepID=A0A9K3NZ08_HELAN|nr:hypothetical protein HanXRQr2_Chr02g0057171 [Helianthus annuus]KAJ0939248.1 hypothetical protein HanRHA438_Chr02g0058961 [Helianthus annuus]KAJ0951149.1 hypothetical protein HanPSC8_Chr02g0056581 [Helianthus annuus]